MNIVITDKDGRFLRLVKVVTTRADYEVLKDNDTLQDLHRIVEERERLKHPMTPSRD